MVKNIKMKPGRNNSHPVILFFIICLLQRADVMDRYLSAPSFADGIISSSVRFAGPVCDQLRSMVEHVAVATQKAVFEIIFGKNDFPVGLCQYICVTPAVVVVETPVLSAEWYDRDQPNIRVLITQRKDGFCGQQIEPLCHSREERAVTLLVKIQNLFGGIRADLIFCGAG